MFSRIIFVIFAGNFIIAGSGFKPLVPAVLSPTLKCFEAGERATVAVLQAMQERPDTDVDKIKMSCLFLQVAGSCMVGVVGASSPMPKLYQFFAAMQYQYHFLMKEAGLCKDLPYDDLKKIALESGVMEEEKLINIENDDYAACAGDVVRKCMLDCMIMLEHQVDPITTDLKYIECMENEAKTCTAPMMEHFMGQLEAYKKLMKGLYPVYSDEDKETIGKSEL